MPDTTDIASKRMRQGTLYGVPIFIDEEYTFSSIHRLIMSANGVHQCLDCGAWVKGVIWLLNEQPCVSEEEHA